MPSARTWIIAAGVLGGLGVIMGAFGSHALPNYLKGLEPSLTAEDRDHRSENYEIGVRYQIYHALAILTLGVLALNHDHKAFRLAGVLMVIGSVMFSGGLYLVALLDKPPLVHFVVPTGGFVLILGWLATIVGGVSLGRGPRA